MRKEHATPVNEQVDYKRLPLKYPLETSLCLLIVAIVIVTFAQVLFRYVFKSSLAWSEELARFILLWLASLSAAYAFKTKSHFALTFLVDRFGKRLKKVVISLVMLILVAFLSIFIVKGFEYTLSAASRIAPGTGLPMSVPFSSAVIGGILMLYYIVQNWRAEMQELSGKR